MPNRSVFIFGFSFVSLSVGFAGIYYTYLCSDEKRDLIERKKAALIKFEVEEKAAIEQEKLRITGLQEAARQKALDLQYPRVRLEGDSCKHWEQYPKLCGVPITDLAYADRGSGVCVGDTGRLQYCKRPNLNHDDCEKMCTDLNGTLKKAAILLPDTNMLTQDRLNGTVDSYPHCVAYNPDTHKGSEGYVNGFCFVHFTGKWPYDDDDRWSCVHGDESGIVTGQDGSEGGTCWQKVHTAEYFGIVPPDKARAIAGHDHAVAIAGDGSLRCGNEALDNVPIFKAQPAVVKNDSYPSFGILMMFTTDSLLSGAHVLSNILSLTELRPSLIYATIDNKNKSFGRAEEWAAHHFFEMQELARRLRDAAQHYHIPGAVIPTVLVEALHSSSCMMGYLAKEAFNCSSHLRVQNLCNMDFMFMNSVAYTWGIARLENFVERVVHVDDDMCLHSRKGPHWRSIKGDFLRVSYEVMDTNKNLLAIMIEEGPCWIKPDTNDCVCDEGFLQPFGTPNKPMGVLPLHGHCKNTTCYCGLLLGGFLPNSVAFSCQSFVLDPAVFTRDWPFKLHYEAHVEELFAATYGFKAMSVWLPQKVLNVGRVRLQEARKQAVEGRFYEECFFSPVPDTLGRNF